MSERGDGGDGKITPEAVDSGVKEGIVFSREQQEAIAGLASENTYAKQSKWQTFRELPMQDKWPYFVQHFLIGTIVVVLVVATAVGFTVNFLTKPPDPLLYVAGVNLPAKVADPIEKLENEFVEDQGLDSQLVAYDGDFVVTESGFSGATMDSSARLLTMASVGRVNTVVTDRDTFEDLSARGIVGPLSSVLSEQQIDKLTAAGVTLEADSTDAEGGGTALKGLDLSRSAVWASYEALPDDAVLGFSNVRETGAEYPRKFVEFLNFS